MKFHPFTLTFYHRMKQQENAMDEFTGDEIQEGQEIIPLLTFHPSQPFQSDIHLFRVGDIYYHQELNKYFLFDMEKEAQGNGDIKGFGFYLLNVVRTDFINYYDTISYFSYKIFCDKFIANYPNDLEGLLSFVGNVHVHAEMTQLFECHLEETKNLKGDLLMIKDKDSRKNSRWPTIYVAEPGGERPTAINVCPNNAPALWKAMKKSGGKFELFLLVKLHLDFDGYDDAIIKKHIKPFQGSFFQSTTGVFHSMRDLDEDHLKDVPRRVKMPKEQRVKWLKSLLYYKEFFLSLSEDGKIKPISLQRHLNEDLLARHFLLYPSWNIYDEKSPFDGDAVYFEKLLEILD